MFNWKFFFFLQNFADPFYGFFWESWSLSVEEWFYLLFPVILIFSLRFIRLMQAYFILTLVLIVLPLYWRHVHFDSSLDDFWMDVSRRKVVIFRMDSIAYGLLMAWIHFYYSHFISKISKILLICGALLIIVFNYADRSSGSYVGQVLQFSIVPFSAMLLLPQMNLWSMKNSLFVRSITHISRISYSMYLINLGIVAAIFRDNFGPFSGWEGIGAYLLYWLLVIVLSSILYRYFEKPVMDLRDKI